MEWMLAALMLVVPMLIASYAISHRDRYGIGIEQVWVPAGIFLMGSDVASIDGLGGATIGQPIAMAALPVYFIFMRTFAPSKR